MIAWLLLTGAIVSEVTATLSLRAAAVGGRKRWYAVVAVGYLTAFSLLALTLGEGMALGVAYGVWAAAGVALTAVASAILFKERLTFVMGVGILLIIAGVLLIELGAGH